MPTIALFIVKGNNHSSLQDYLFSSNHIDIDFQIQFCFKYILALYEKCYCQAGVLLNYYTTHRQKGPGTQPYPLKTHAIVRITFNSYEEQNIRFNIDFPVKSILKIFSCNSCVTIQLETLLLHYFIALKLSFFFSFRKELIGKHEYCY